MSTGADLATRADYCVFHRAGRDFAISTHLAKEVIETKSFTPIPSAPPELLGALNVRGEVVPLVALDSFLGLPERAPTRGDALLVLGLSDLRFATIVDRVDTVKHFAPWEIRREEVAGKRRDPLVRGIAGNAEARIEVLDGEGLFAAVVECVGEGFRRAARLESEAAGPALAGAPDHGVPEED
ncbi:MAG: hypothetical protein FJ144_16280 [Deltaproteobacteria bacterium]|nr:hypothetical protein [Deltaproteobacteria bacterium]